MKPDIRIRKQLNKNLRKDWIRLWSQSEYSHFFNSSQWFECCRNTFKYNNFIFVTAYNDSRLVGILPLVKNTFFGIQSYCEPGIVYLDRSTVLVSDRSIIEPLLSGALELGNIKLSEVPPNFLPSIKIIKPSSISESSINPYLPLNDDPFKFLTKKQKSKIFNKQKKFEHDLEYKIFTGSKKSLEIAIEIDKKSMKYARGQASFGDRQSANFYTNLITYFRRQIVIDILYFKKQPVIYSIGLADKKIYHALSTSYNKDYQFLIPGKLLLFYILRRLHKESYKELHFSRGTNVLKREFTPHAYTQYDVYFTSSPTTNWWWNTAKHIRTTLIANRTFYSAYCSVKRLLY